jgi:hypothetical protein
MSEDVGNKKIYLTRGSCKTLNTRGLRNTILEQKNRISKSQLEKASFARG